jgi:hypothetical protein
MFISLWRRIGAPSRICTYMTFRPSGSEPGASAFRHRGKLERPPGIAPGYPRWQRGTLLLSYDRKMVGVGRLELPTSRSRTERSAD